MQISSKNYKKQAYWGFVVVFYYLSTYPNQKQKGLKVVGFMQKIKITTFSPLFQEILA